MAARALQCRPYRAGGDGVDADTFRRELFGQSLSEDHDRALGGGSGKGSNSKLLKAKKL